MARDIKWEKLFSYDTLVYAVAGSVGSVTAMTTFYPLDTVRSRLQVEDRDAKNTWTLLQEFIREEGFESLYRGLGPVLTSLCCSNFVYFYTFHGLRSVYKRDAKSHSALTDLALASIAGAVNVLLTTPLWVVNTRLRLQNIKLKLEDRKSSDYSHYKGIIDGLCQIKKVEGWKGIYGGLVPSLILVSNPALQFMIYESLKRRMSKGSESKYGTDELKQMNVIYMLLYIAKKQGFKELYKGMEAKILQTVLTAALMFLCYEKIAALVFALLKRKQSLSH
ncbi:peroxisomal membrane protein PMP34-like [Centruroides sculpturatus]|uniref:peroxisomal membrane protein PMP34-like n=1 Tax=Centruroides sculpturatus TaxID=218467 RepID=UPI000C6D870D|nr:peroxisomal membrane protein PMP34-like [Centruroides sculpturatus]